MQSSENMETWLGFVCIYVCDAVESCRVWREFPRNPTKQHLIVRMLMFFNTLMFERKKPHKDSRLACVLS